MSKGIVISGFAGIGKTTVVEQAPNRIVDLESSDYKWIYDDEQTANMQKENRKGVSNKRQHPEWPFNYIKAIEEHSKRFDIVLVSQQEDLRSALDNKNIDYILCFPNTDCKENYIERYTNRGNQDVFVELIKNNFEKWIEDLKSCPQKQLILSVGEYLQDALLREGLL